MSLTTDDFETIAQAAAAIAEQTKLLPQTRIADLQRAQLVIFHYIAILQLTNREQNE